MAGGWSRFALRFSEYYGSLDSASLWTPPRLKSREWMFVPWGGAPPDRHRAFQSNTELLHYLQNRPPHSCFHSTAYYQRPSNRKMSEKGWLGADLIFDLDGDHPVIGSSCHKVSWTQLGCAGSRHPRLSWDVLSRGSLDSLGSCWISWVVLPR